MSALVDALYAPSSDAAHIYDTFNAASFLFDNATAAAFCDAGNVGGAAPPLQHAADAPALEDIDATSPACRKKRRRRVRMCKSKEEAESQRLTHIAVERNRRRQMNEYLTVLRSLMPEGYVQRGDQASIVGGAIDFVKELEQQLQYLEAQKRTLAHQNHKARSDAMPVPVPVHGTSSTNTAAATPPCCVDSATTTSNCSSSVTEDQQAAPDGAPPFAGFFAYPQYVWCHRSARDVTMPPAEDSGARPSVADIEVILVESHANVRVMAPRRPGQLLKMITGVQALGLTVLHLTVTTLDSLALYSLNVKVEEGCAVTTEEDIASALHHVLCIIDADAVTQQLLAVGH